MKAFLPARERSDFVNALKLYLTRVFWLGMPLSILLPVWLSLDVGSAWQIRSAMKAGIHHALDSPAMIFFLYTEVTALVTLYIYVNRQVKDSQSWSIPGLVVAETRAAFIVYLIINLFTSLLLAWAHFNFANAFLYMLFNSLAPITMWYAHPSAKGQPLGTRDKCMAALFISAFILQIGLVFIHHLILLILTCSPLLAGFFDCVLLMFIAVTMMTYPNRIYRNDGNDEEINTKTYTTLFSKFANKKKRKTSSYELQQQLLEASQPRPLWMDCSISLLALPVVTFVIAVIQYMLHVGSATFTADWASILSGSVIFASMGSSSTKGGGFSLDNWLNNRDHWIPIFATGRFGTRKQFVSTVFRAKLMNLCIMTPLTTIGLIVPYAICAKISLRSAVIITVSMILLYISSSLCTAVPFALTRHPPKWSLHVGALCPFLALVLLNPFTRDPTAISVPIVVMLAIGIFSFSRAGKRLAKEDWVIEND